MFKGCFKSYLHQRDVRLIRVRIIRLVRGYISAEQNVSKGEGTTRLTIRHRLVFIGAAGRPNEPVSRVPSIEEPPERNSLFQVQHFS